MMLSQAIDTAKQNLIFVTKLYYLESSEGKKATTTTNKTKH